MIKGVIFDFNGTLFFDNDKHVKAWGAISRLLRNKKDIIDEEFTNILMEFLIKK